MTTNVDLLRITRQNVLKSIDGLSLERLNKIPDGFTGNIAWHIGHLVATQQGLIYSLGKIPTQLEQSFIDRYKKGTVPKAPIDQKELDFIIQELAMQTEKLMIDLEMGLFKEYTSYTTSYGNTINSTEEAITFVNIHEGLHLGYIMAMKHLV